MIDQCELCELENFELTKHHLIPKTRGGSKGPFCRVCEPCHKMVNMLFTNKELEFKYYTVKLLRSSDSLGKYLRWVRKREQKRLKKL